jgi:transmembrane sensor
MAMTNRNTPKRLEDFPELPMAGSRDMAQYEPSDAQIGAAMLWLTRLREAGETTSRPFERWLAEHPAHAFAWAESEALFAFSAGPAKRAARHYHRHGPAKARRRRWSMALGALAASAAALLVMPSIETLRFLGADAVAAPGELKTVRLADGSRITLNTASALDIDISRRGRHVKLRRGGEAFFDIAKDPAHPFTVDAGPARIRVLGTRFNVRIDADQAIIGVNEGKVRVARADGGTATILVPGQELIVDGQAMQRQALDAFASSAWRRREMVVRRTPLRMVVDELNRYRSADIYLFNSALGESRISGVFRTNDPKDSVRTLERALGVKSVTLPTGQVILY